MRKETELLFKFFKKEIAATEFYGPLARWGVEAIGQKKNLNDSDKIFLLAVAEGDIPDNDVRLKANLLLKDTTIGVDCLNVSNPFLSREKVERGWIEENLGF